MLLSEVRGPFVEDNRSLSNKIAFKCQSVVFMYPYFFRETPWVPIDVDDPKKDDDDNKDCIERDAESRTYKEWIYLHDDYRFNVDVRAVSATLRERYGVTLVSVFGTCHRGGRSLEAAAGWVLSLPSLTVVVGYGIDNNNVRELDEGEVQLSLLLSSTYHPPPPPSVNPASFVAWYTTRYNAQALFGTKVTTNKEQRSYSSSYASSSALSRENNNKVSAMVIFA